MKEKLLSSAGELIPPGQQTIDEFTQKRDAMAEQCTIELKKRNDLDELIGPKNIQMAADNNRNFARFMQSIFTDFEPGVLVETVLWVFEAYRSHGFKTTYWPANLNIWIDRLKTELSGPAFDEIYPFYHWLIINIPLFVKLTNDHARDESFSDDIASRHIAEE